MTADTAADRLSSAPESPGAPPLAPREFGRWAWRQLTSMRTALILLFLLALAAVPGSVVPQEGVDSVKAAQWRESHTTLAPIYDKLGLFSVYDSVWFSAIYLLLMVSLVGCILPRTRVYWRALRARPPAAPRHLSRLPEYRTFEADATPEEVLERARVALRGYRVVTDGDGISTGSISGERGKIREAGNLLFHLAILVVLVGFAGGSLLGFKGGVIVVTGNTFANSLSQYDDFKPGGLFGPDDLAPFDFTVTDFDVTFITEGREAGMAHKFSAGLDYRTSPTADVRHTRISVNHPLSIDGTKVYLISHGYAPHITVRDGNGDVAYSGPVVFLPEDSTFRSFGVVKVPDVSGGQPQVGLVGFLLPTAAQVGTDQWVSTNPEPNSPMLVLSVWSGDLGLDTGVPQNVYQLDEKGLTESTDAAGKPVTLYVRPGDTVTLPDGLGTLTFDGIRRYAAFDLRKDPALGWLLAFALTALAGLAASLFVPRRRLWVRASPSTPDRDEGPTTVVTAAGLARGDDVGLAPELGRVLEAVLGSPVPITGRPPAEGEGD